MFATCPGGLGGVDVARLSIALGFPLGPDGTVSLPASLVDILVCVCVCAWVGGWIG